MNSLYVHFPFCLKKCNYCDFYSIDKDSWPEDIYKQYLEALKNDLLQWTSPPGPLSLKRGGGISTVYLGGGTPSLFPVELLSELFEFIAKQVKFDPEEVTIEVNPATIDRSKLKAYKELGINRISLGVQSFNDDELKTLGRVHSSQDAIKSFDLIREVGFKNVSIDLMFRIPGQILSALQKNLEKAKELDPEHLSVYSLTLEENTPLFTLVKEKKAVLPSEDEDHEMYSKTIQFLNKNGYFQYEISNFAKKTFESRHNLNYWDNGEYIGLGAGAHSQVNGQRWYNDSNIEAYVKNTGNVRQNSGKIMVSEAVFLGLRRLLGVDLRAFQQRYGVSLPDTYPHEIQDLSKNGLIDVSNGTLRLTERGIFLADQVFQKFV